MRPARVARKVHGVGDVDQVTLDAELVGGDSAEHVLGHQAVLAGVRSRGNGQRDARAALLDRQVVAVGREHGGDVRHALGIAHFFSPTGTELPDHSPKILTTMEMAAFFAPATMTGTCCGADRMRWNSSSVAKVPSGLRGTFSLPARSNSRPVWPHFSIIQFCTSALDRPAAANIWACSGQSTSATEVCGKISDPIRLTVSSMSRSTSSWLGVCRLSTNSMVRVSVAEIAETRPVTPSFSANGSQGDSSSFSAMQTCQRPGRPWVACSRTCGWMPNALRTVRPTARGIVAFGRNPGPKAPPAVLKPSSFLTGPLTTISGDGPLVDWNPPPRAARSRMSASNAARTTGKYSGLQPAMAALIAAVRTLTSRPTCSRAPMISSGSLPVVARNASSSGLDTGTSGSPSDQPCS